MEFGKRDSGDWCCYLVRHAGSSWISSASGIKDNAHLTWPAFFCGYLFIKTILFAMLGVFLIH